MIISVDTGNKQMKTENCEFNSGVEILDTLPGELEEVIEYEGKYYRTTNRRISYMEADTMAMPQKISRGTLISQGKERAFFSKLNENRLTRDSFNDCQYYRNNINKKTLAELNALMDSEKTTLEHVELNEADLSDEIIQEFDCGNDDMNEYLYDYARDDSVYGRGVTYVLVADDRKRIYAYATLKTHSLYYYEEEK